MDPFFSLKATLYALHAGRMTVSVQHFDRMVRGSIVNFFFYIDQYATITNYCNLDVDKITFVWCHAEINKSVK